MLYEKQYRAINKFINLILKSKKYLFSSIQINFFNFYVQIEYKNNNYCKSFCLDDKFVYCNSFILKDNAFNKCLRIYKIELKE